MSSDIGLLPFKDGEPSTLSSALVLQVLKSFIRPVVDARYGERWELVFPDGGDGDMEPIVEGADENGLAIGHHCGFDLLDALYEIMRQTHTLLYWSGVDSLVTADEAIADHLPPDYIEKFGAPPLVRSGADIAAEIAKT
jgi:hypothetical protein